MGRNFAVCYAAAVSALILAGCTQHGAAEPTPTVEPTAQPVVTGAPTEPVDPTISPLQPCGDIGTAATLPDCSLQSHDPAGLAFEIRHTGTRAHVVTTVKVLDTGGSTIQTIVEPDTDAMGAVPKLRDIDNDGRDDLIVPLALATANVRYAVYHVSGDSLEYHRAGELAGVGIDTSATGLVIVSARDSYASWDIQFWTFAADKLRPLVTAQVRPIDDGTGKVAGTTCTAVDSGGLSTLPLTPDQATDQFCAEPAVQRVRRS